MKKTLLGGIAAGLHHGHPALLPNALMERGLLVRTPTPVAPATGTVASNP